MVLTTRQLRPTARGWSLFVSLALVAASVLALSLGGQRSATVADFLSRTPVAHRDLRVGVFGDQPLLGSVDSRGRRVGFDVELAAALARSLGIRPVYVALAPQERLRALVERRVDVVFAGLLMTAERRRSIDFAGPYLTGDIVALAQRSWSGRLAGARVCTVEGSTVDDLLTGRRVTLTHRRGQRDCVDDVRAGRVDATVGDEITLRGQAHAAGGALHVFPLGGGLPEQRYGIGVTPGDRYLRALVDSFLLASYGKGEAGAWQRVADRTLVPAGYTRGQPRPEGTLLRGADDGEPVAGAAVLPVLAPAASTPARRRPARRRRGAAPPRRPWPPRRPVADPPEHPAGTTGVDRSPAWSLLLGVPVAVSALYLWIQSGGDRQFTLMLADSVNPITFLATVSLSVVWIFFAVPAMVCTVGAVVLASATDAADRRALCRRHPVARWTARTPPWAIGLSVLTAALSTPLVLLPAWGFALYLAVRPAAASRWRTPLAALLLAVPAVAIAEAAWREGEAALVLIAGWPVPALLLAGAGTVHRAAVATFVRAGGALAAVLAAGVLYAVVTTPILPSTAIQVARPVAPTPTGAPAVDPDTATGGTAVRQVRGYVVSVDGETTTILSDLGGVEILPNADIVSRISCPSFTDLPGDSAALAGLSVRESLLKALARRQRPAALQDPRCVVGRTPAPDEGAGMTPAPTGRPGG
ncbi:transporter substrate-binding domain-containing protein [Micromonospora sp. NPDC050495]|uniref:transporter substrate-binding domain-containing protein n=1 Tax=Micromonospora sp. NPDC050495 TaxID=3154936 RepID=UPI0033DA1A03